jgi:hypothetical protein
MGIDENSEADHQIEEQTIRDGVKRLGMREAAAMGARLVVRFSCLDDQIELNDTNIRGLCKHAGHDARPVRPSVRPEPSRIFTLGGHGSYVAKECAHLRTALDRHERGDADEKEVRARLFECICAAGYFSENQGRRQIIAAVIADLTNGAVAARDSQRKGKPLDPSGRGDLGPLWPGGAPSWWRETAAITL